MLKPMNDTTYRFAHHIAAIAQPTPLPPGTNDYGPLAYLVWIAGGLLILAIAFFGIRVLRKMTSHRRHG